MDFWDLIQEKELRELRERLDSIQLEQDLDSFDARGTIQELISENVELRLRIELLTKLLIAKGVISAEEFAKLLFQARSWKSQSS